jgi:hypothetical protein
VYKIDSVNGKYAVTGGKFLGGGGGGSDKEGFNTLEASLDLGEIVVKDIEDFDDDDIIVTASAVGSPASTEGYISVEQIIENYNLFKKIFGKDIKGIITNENGGHSTTNGWLLSAATGIPLIDAPCNGRAHPTGVMGSMGLEKVEGYKTIQTASGGRNDNSITVFAEGTMDSAAKIIRQAAVEAGGLVTVIRNPAKAKYVKDNAAVKSLSQAVEIGEIFEESHNVDEIIEKMEINFGLEIIARGTVSNCELVIEGGFDHGYVKIKDKKKEYKVTFWNEFMTADDKDNRLATFPDLIGCMEVGSGKVLSSAEIKKDDQVYIYKIPADKLILGSGMKNREQFKLIEKILNIEILDYISKE